MKSILFFLLTTFPILLQAQNYNLYIQNDLGEWLPARINFQNINGKKVLNIKNSEENIQLMPKTGQNDTLFYHFVDYNAEIALIKEANNMYSGYWINYESSVPKKRLVVAFPDNSSLPDKYIAPQPFNGNWKAKIIRQNRATEAILVLKQNKDEIYGTIRTNSGDYRYLQGLVTDDGFYLSSFSGNSAFYMVAKYQNDTIKAVLHGLTTNDIQLIAIHDEAFQLSDAENLTKVINDKPFNLNLPNDKGIPQDFENLIKNKVSIVSIFGTWCPNCVDETNYFNELQKKFPELKIITVAFENTDDLHEREKRVQGFIQRKNIDNRIIFLLAEKPNGENVKKHFPMIDKFSAYPTSFLIDKQGKIRVIHTGFDGPATGIFYDKYKEEMERNIENLLKH